MLTTIATFDTEYSADSIEWCPHDENYFVCGTYQLDEKESQFGACKRKGRIYLFKFNVGEETLHEVFRLETNAILDQKWHPVECLLATADSLGFVTIYKLDGDSLVSITSTKIDYDDDILALALEWNKNGNMLIVTDSKGGFTLYNFSNNELNIAHQQIKAHGFEAWTCAFDTFNPNTIFTGGDDTFLNCYDVRTQNSECQVNLKWKNKSHGAGVTSLFSPLHAENILITGSYDENLRYFDIRNPKSSIFDINLGGGIWRIKQHPRDVNKLLTANMYHNFTVLDFTSNAFKINQSYHEHKSICYGADWHPRNYTNKLYFATCSFYDHKLCVVRYEK